MRKLKKLDTRGGLRQKTVLKSSQALLLQELWKKYGGISKAAKKIGLPLQTLINWRLRGRVPLEMVGVVSRALNVSKECLCYEDYYKLLGYGNDWKYVVKQLKFEPKIEKMILKGEWPKV